MQEVSSSFTTNTKKASRVITARLEIDWDLDNNYTDETDYVLLLEIERKVSEPLGGISLAMADVSLSNETDRFTPPPRSS